MNKQHIILLFVLFGLILISSYNVYNNSSKDDTVTLNISAQSYMPVSKMSEHIRNDDYYEGYDEKTLKWFETLDGYVFSSNNSLVVVDSNESEALFADKFVTDVDISNIIDCRIVENRSLGNKLSDIIVVDEVKLKSQEKYYYEV